MLSKSCETNIEMIMLYSFSINGYPFYLSFSDIYSYPSQIGFMAVKDSRGYMYNGHNFYKRF